MNITDFLLPAPAIGAMDHIALDLSRSIAAKKDELIGQAICSRLGTNWTLDDLRGRLECHIDHEHVQVIRLDGEPILELHPMRTWTEPEGRRTMLKAAFQWRLL